jgi:membrane-associated phospholipid phosphatase
MKLGSVARRLICACSLSLCGERAAFAQARAADADVPQNAPIKPSLWRDSWPQFSATEGVLTLLAGLGTGIIVLIGPKEEPRWQGGILFDDAVRKQLRAGSSAARQRYRTVGNWTYHLSPAVPFFDALVVATIGHGDEKLAVNLGAVSLEAFSYTGLSAFVATETSARARPDGQDTQSFFSGHAAITATSAGLVCANHTHIALYGNALADAAICALMIGDALTTATTRVIADRHYASDVILGTSIGFGIGYAVPVLLHYSLTKHDIAFGVDPSCGNCLSVSGLF